MNIQRFSKVLVSVVALLALAACGGGGGEAANGDAADSGGGGGETTVTIADNAFDPAEASASAGGSVTWTNNDDVPHTVTFDGDAVESSEELNQGDTFSASFDEAGEYSYICSIHPDMKGSVSVS